MPMNIWALDGQIEYPRLWEAQHDEDGEQYIHKEQDRAQLRERIEGMMRSEDEAGVGIGSLARIRGHNAALKQVLEMLDEYGDGSG